MSAPRLQLSGISKRYGGVIANAGIDLAVQPGEIHALLGENGAGKSTLMKIVYGVTRPDEGRIEWEGHEPRIDSPARARALGIGMVFQHFSLFESLSVAENIALALDGRDSPAALAPRIREVSERYGLPVDPQRLVHGLSVGERQRVEIVRCLLQAPRLLIMDEPTSVLTPQAVEQLFVTLRRLAAEGVSILYISHKLDEIRALCDVATVLRAGRVEGRVRPREASKDALARMMIGRELEPCRLAPREPGAIELELTNLSQTRDDPFGTALRHIDLRVRAGQIVGIAGVSGNGQKELLAAISGERRVAERGMVRIGGEPVGDLDPAQRRRRGLGFVPEERLGRGAVPALSLALNALLTGPQSGTAQGAALGLVRHGLLRPAAARAFARRIIERYAVRCRDEDAAAGSLSGGNLQKFIVGREVLLAPKVLVVAQPTWGVDVGAAQLIRQALIDLRDAGAAVLVISEELDELFEISDLIGVIAGGRLSSVCRPDRIDPAGIGRWMAGDFAAASREPSLAAA